MQEMRVTSDLCAHVCIHVSVPMYMRVHMHVETRRQPLVQAIILGGGGKGLSLAWNLPNRLGWLPVSTRNLLASRVPETGDL